MADDRVGGRLGVGECLEAVWPGRHIGSICQSKSECLSDLCGYVVHMSSRRSKGKRGRSVDCPPAPSMLTLLLEGQIILIRLSASFHPHLGAIPRPTTHKFAALWPSGSPVEQQVTKWILKHLRFNPSPDFNSTYGCKDLSE